MGEMYKLTSPQKSIWLTELFYKNTSINNISGNLIIQEKVDFDILEKSINIFIQKNDAIRTKISIANNTPMQSISDFIYEKLTINNIKNEPALVKWGNVLGQIPFEIIDNKLYKFSIFKLPNGTGGFNATLHHIISDAWTFSLLIDQIMNTYEKLLNNEEIDVENNTSYIEFIKSEQEYLNSERYIKNKEYWKNVFSSDINLTTIKENNSINNKTNAVRKLLHIPEKLKAKLDKFSKENKVSAYSILTAILNIYLYKISNNKSVIIGTPVLNRSNFKEKNMVGDFVSTVPFKMEVNTLDSFDTFVSKVAKEQLTLFRNQKFPYERIFDIAKEKTSLSQALFNIVLSYQNARDSSKNARVKYSTQWFFTGNISNLLDIHIYDMDDTGIPSIMYDYQVANISEKEVLELHNRLMYILEQVLNNPQIILKDIKIVTQNEEKLIKAFNRVSVYYPSDKNIIQLFENQVKKVPDKIAIIFEDEKITYKELNIKANQVASHLVHKGIKQNGIVGILMNRSIDMFISILGVLKSGAAYLPIDINYPTTHIDYVLSDSGANYCIVDDKYNTQTNCKSISFKEMLIDNTYTENMEIEVSSDSLCYLIYTSGSTGRPKGVKTKHQNVVNYTYSFMNEFKLNEKDRVFQQCSPSFDAFTEEFYPAILNGTTIVAVSKEKMSNVVKTSEYINKNKVTLISCTPLYLNELNKIENANLKNVKVFISGGDVLKKDYYTNLIKNSKIYNTYGPTETTVCSTYHCCSEFEIDPISIGKTIANYKNYIVNIDNELQPIGIAGELCIGGEGVTLGYINNEELTQDKFITTSFSDGKILYKTGDLCRINADGEIQFLGRIDRQVKIRGYRITASEIEKFIMQYPGINNCRITLFKDNTDKQHMCAYFTSNSNVSKTEIKDYLGKIVPNYMIPDIFIKLDTMPTNINGKLDTSKLPDPHEYFNQLISNYIPPRTKIEREICEIWEKILEIGNMSIDADIFDMGADSLSIIAFQSSAINKEWSFHTQDFYDYPTVRELANKINTRTESLLEEKYEQINIRDINLPNKKYKTKTILLTGATGFLGIHLLEKLINNYNDIVVYCMVRGKNNEFSEQRLKVLYKKYFNKNMQVSRIKTVSGDITKEYFGLSETEYKNLTNKVDTVIHSAALVKHYGNFETFKKVNVDATNNIIEFCLENDKQLHYISTISVSGIFLLETDDRKSDVFTENDFYIGQNYNDNVYIKSKVEAEYNVLDSIRNRKLYAKIYRIGNLCGRYSDGVFQENIDENAFYNRLKSIMYLKVLPEEFINTSTDLTPVDLASESIIKIITANENQIVYHIQNGNTLKLKELIGLMNIAGNDIKIVSNANFYDRLNKLTLKEKKYIDGIINDIDMAKKMNKDFVVVVSSITNQFLEKYKFKWPEIGLEYIEKIIKYMKEIEFIGGTDDEIK